MRNGERESIGNDGWCVKNILQISPDRGTPPETMEHNVLNSNIVIKSIIGSRSVEFVEPMANRRDVPEGKNLL